MVTCYSLKHVLFVHWHSVFDWIIWLSFYLIIHCTKYTVYSVILCQSMQKVQCYSLFHFDDFLIITKSILTNMFAEKSCFSLNLLRRASSVFSMFKAKFFWWIVLNLSLFHSYTLNVFVQKQNSFDGFSLENPLYNLCSF